MATRAGDASSDSALLLSLINQARVSAGLVPFSVSATLTGAAQAHALDMAQHGVALGHSGSDGSTPTQRIVGAGYPGYSWGPFVGENWAAYRTIQESMDAWMSDQPHRSNILSTTYREIGIGVARTFDGVPILVTDFGAEPNVLPVFLSGAGATVTLSLSNENAAPAGDGPKVIGLSVSVEIAEDAAFTHSRSFPFAASIEYSAADGKEVSTLFVRFHDGAGRTTVSSTAHGPVLVSPASASAPVSPSPTPTKTITPRPPPTATRRPLKPTATPAPPTETAVPPTTVLPTTTVPTVTPTAVRELALRRAVPTPGIPGSSDVVESPVIPPAAAWLFVASGLVLSFAAAIFVRRRMS